jgi:hemoglobin
MSVYNQIGYEKLVQIMTDFYDRLFNDVFVGFIFAPFDKAHLIHQQVLFTGSLLGAKDLKFEGKSLREAHANLPIRPAHFARRQVILKEVLNDHSIDLEVIEEWLRCELQLKSQILSNFNRIK